MVAGIQRQRLLEAMLQVVGEHGYESTSVQDVLERASTSRRAFYESFSSKPDCYLAAYDAGVEHFIARIGAAAGSESDWRSRLRAGIAELLDLLDQEPAIGRALLVEVHAAGPGAVARRMKAMRRFAEMIEPDIEKDGSHGVADAPAMAAKGVVGGIDSTLRSQLRQERPSLAALLPELTHFAVIPYLGPEAAEEELRLSRSGG